MIDGITDLEFKNQFVSVVEALSDLGAFVEPGDVGVSWRLRLPSRDISVCWFFPEGKLGWMGMRYLTVGIATSVENLDPESGIAVEALAKSVELCNSGGKPFTAAGVRGRQMNAEDVGEAAKDLVKAIHELKSDLS